MSGEDCMLVCRSDSSAARSLAGRLGIGRACHIEANLLWLQQKVAEKSLTITPIPTELNPADIGTKYMPKVRLNGLKYMIKMVDYGSHRIGIHEYKELEAKEQLRKDMQKFPKKGGFTGRVAMIIALSLMRQSEGQIRLQREACWRTCRDEPTFSMCYLVGSGWSLESGYGLLVLWREIGEGEPNDVGFQAKQGER